MKKLILITLFLVRLNTSVYSQKGDYYLTHYTPNNEQIQNENFAIVQDLNGQMYFANAKGVLKFDGRFWQLLKTPSSVLSLELDKTTGLVYVGCLDDFGFLKIDNIGSEIYQSLLKTENKFSSISKIKIIDDKIYFKGDRELYEYSKSKNVVTRQWSNEVSFSIDQIFVFENNLLISDKKKGLFRLDGKSFQRLHSSFPKGEKVVFCSNNIIGTDANLLYLFDGRNVKLLEIESKSYLQNSLLNDGILLESGILFISTNKGGCVLIDSKTGKTVNIINYYSGLPDDVVYAIGKDNKAGIWIAHEYGFTRADFYLPFRCFSTYPGLEGHLSAAVTYRGKLYVATSEGVYYLNEVNNSAELDKVLKSKYKNKPKIAGQGLNIFVQKQKENFEKIKKFFKIDVKNKKTESQSESSQTVAQDTVKRKKKFLGIFNRKEKRKISTIETPKGNKKSHKTVRNNSGNSNSKSKFNSTTKSLQKSKYSEMENLEFQSVKYLFRKIKGIDAKSLQLIPFKDKLLVATNNGIYEIDGTESRLICSGSINYLYLSKNETNFYAGTEDKRLLIYSFASNKWVRTSTLDNFAEDIINLAEDQEDNLWVSCYNAIFRFTKDNRSTIVKIDTFPINNPFSDNISLVSSGGKMKVLCAANIFYYNQNKNQLILEVDTAIKNAPFYRLIQSENNIVWHNDGKQWKYLSDKLNSNKNFEYFRIFKDLQDIFVDRDKKHCWVITKGNNLYYFDIKKQSNSNRASNIFLKSINDNEGKLLKIKDFEVDEDKSFVTFNFVNPEYLDNTSLEYQYKLLGHMENWSEWSLDNKIPFPSLESGKYHLVVRTRNTLNQITESEPVLFVVNPPYWQQWWFYMIEFLFFGLLMIGSNWFNRSHAANKTNKWISRIFTLITIVTFIEFINTILASFIEVDDSPVPKFLIQVGIALIIFPFEGILSNIIHNKKPISLPLKKK